MFKILNTHIKKLNIKITIILNTHIKDLDKIYSIILNTHIKFLNHKNKIYDLRYNFLYKTKESDEMNINKKLEQLLNIKQPFEQECLEKEYTYVVYLFNEDSLIYIGKTPNYLKFIDERAKKFYFTHYAIEQLDTELVDNLIAEMIIKFNPIGNHRIPNNTKYISHTKAKEKYELGKLEFKQLWKEQKEQLMYETQMILEIKVIQDYTGQLKPKHNDLPKIGRLILLKTDIQDNYLASSNSYSKSIAYNEVGQEIEVMVKSYTKDEINFITEYYLNKSYEVTSLLSYDTFEAYNPDEDKKIILKAQEYKTVWEYNHRR